MSVKELGGSLGRTVRRCPSAGPMVTYNGAPLKGGQVC